MKTLLTSLFCLASLCLFSQKKEYTEKQLLTNKRILEFSTSMQTSPKNTIDFLKCIKDETNIKQFRKLPFFTGKLTMIVNKKISQHNDELWEAIHQECKEKTIFVNN